MYISLVTNYIPGTMISEEKRKILRYRVDLVLRNLSNCNSGAEVHEVGNMRNVAQLILELCDCDESSEDQCFEALKTLESQVKSFFQKKYSYLSSQKRY